MTPTYLADERDLPFDIQEGRSSRVRAVWPTDAWNKGKNKAWVQRGIEDGRDIYVVTVYPPEIDGVVVDLSRCARGRRGDWEILFEYRGLRTDRIGDIKRELREGVVGTGVEDYRAVLDLKMQNRVRQVLITKGHGLRRDVRPRREEMSREFIPTFRLTNGLYLLVLSPG